LTLELALFFYFEDSVIIRLSPFLPPLPILSPLASLCDLFRTSGGLQYVLNLLYQRPSPELQQAALYTLGCAAERNRKILIPENPCLYTTFCHM